VAVRFDAAFLRIEVRRRGFLENVRNRRQELSQLAIEDISSDETSLDWETALPAN